MKALHAFDTWRWAGRSRHTTVLQRMRARLCPRSDGRR